MSFIDDEQRAVLAGEIAQGLMIAGLGQHDADIGQRRFGQHTSDISMGERRFQRVEIVELDDASS